MSNLFDPPPRWREITTDEMMDCYQFGTVPKGFAQQHVSLTRGEDKMEWQPIETAPKDGSRFLASDGERVLVIEWKAFHGKWRHLTGWNPLYGPGFERSFSHWMPLPDPPLSLYSLGDE